MVSTTNNGSFIEKKYSKKIKKVLTPKLPLSTKVKESKPKKKY